MTKLTRYAFILKGPGYSNEGKINHIDSENFKATVVAVPSIESACDIAKKLITEGIELIELCGGFDHDDLNQINNYVGNKIPLGLVSFNEKEFQKLKSFLDK